MQDQILDLLLKQEEVTWKTLLYDLIDSEKMDPWDIDLTLLTQKYLLAVRKMQEHDLKISGKILLAAAFLLRMKSAHLVDNDLAALNRMMQGMDDSDEDLFDPLSGAASQRMKDTLPLIPKNPQPRSRKVSIHDLITALQEAMASKKRMLAQQKPVHFPLPERKMDIMHIIRDLYLKIQYYAGKDAGEAITFSKLLPPRAGRKEKVYTFIPLLHLENEQKVETTQEKPFEEIFVKVKKSSS
ncbi:segregation/condensation protein A [Candidatus Woesearchaeota archaeon]|nr:segregation/condensation protein A [Candidatus Woesearchaeota archaeon]